ncbi:MAG: nucleotide exchange factor GrpE [Candidatus Poribacteria bacterium]|nr:nucleotide exchange factor GrpE [Candidatus Poribacteria bacterium]
MKFFEKLSRWSQYVEFRRVPPADALESSSEVDDQSQSDPLQDAIADLKKATQKLGRTQFRANAVAESDRKEMKQMLHRVLALSMETQGETLADLLVVVDGLEEGIRAIEQLNDENARAPAWADGFRIVHERMLRILERWDVVPIESVGQPFTPHRHRAVDTIHTDEFAENTVVEEQRRGYLCGEEVLRYAEVVVARKRADER